MQSFIRFYVVLQISPPLLLALDRFEQSLEIALPEAAAALPLNHFIKQRRPIKYRLTEQLQEIPVRPVAINQNAQLLQIFPQWMP